MQASQKDSQNLDAICAAAIADGYACLLGDQTLYDVPSKLHWLVALSGGPDSTALLHYLKQAAPHFGASLNAVIVDHNLRPHSAREARDVLQLCKSQGVDASIMKVTAPPPVANKQAWARDERYKLLCQKAREGGQILWLGHHQDDQAETVAMRLAHDSALAGLSGMAPLVVKQGVVCLRPFLNLKKHILQQACVRHHLSFVQDASNHNTAFERTRWRHLLAQDDLLSDHLVTLSQLAQRADQAFGSILTDTLGDDVTFHDAGLWASLSYDVFLKLPELAQIRLLRVILPQIGACDYGPTFDATKQILSFIKARKNTTLSYCILRYEAGRIAVLPEVGRPVPAVFLAAGNEMIYRGRFLVRTAKDVMLHDMDDHHYGQLDANNAYRKALSELPMACRRLFPFALTLDEEDVTPHLYNSVRPGHFGLCDKPIGGIEIYPIGRIAKKG